LWNLKPLDIPLVQPGEAQAKGMRLIDAVLLRLLGSR
jgi:hypothetical protein